MEHLSVKNRVLIGLTLFSMFFGAGNLIFPPFLGAQAGSSTLPAMAGFALSAIGFPLLGVIAVARSGGLSNLAGRVHPLFASIFTLLIYLAIGPCLAIPRTASTSFEMAVVPFLTSRPPALACQIGYSALFFLLAFLIARKPDKLSDRLGKILTPCLLFLVFLLVAGSILNPPGSYGASLPLYERTPGIQGFLDGYQTMDTIAALNFGIVISLNIRAMGIQDDRQVMQETIRAGWIAGLLLLLVYCGLAHAGALAGGSFSGFRNGAQTLTVIARYLFGPLGTIVLALAFTIACLNTCVGLISCCSQYFATILPFFGYRIWAFFFALVSMIISTAGLTRILEITIPVLSAIYPVSIVLILLSFLHKWIARFPAVYSCSILFTAVVSILTALDSRGYVLPLLTSLVRLLPFYDLGLGWILPAVTGALTGFLL